MLPYVIFFIQKFGFKSLLKVVLCEVLKLVKKENIVDQFTTWFTDGIFFLTKEKA